jgi:hypothetical protein
MIKTTTLVSMHCIKHPESELRLKRKHLIINGNDIMAGFMLRLFALASLYSGRSCSSAETGFMYHENPGKSCGVIVGPT